MYQPPTISTDLGRVAGALARNTNSRVIPCCEQISGIKVKDLIKQYGSPLFVFSETAIRRTAQRARKAFADLYPNTVWAWSYKTNYLQAICNIFHQQGWIAEVVSDIEYQKAEAAGIAGQEIIYNGPCKSRASLEHAISQKALIQIDHWDELKTVEDIAAAKQCRHLDIGIRVWIDTGLTIPWSKFGFAFIGGEAERAALRIIANPRLRLHTLHAHIGTQVLQPQAYANASEQLTVLRHQLWTKTKHLVPCLNLGGGFPSSAVFHELPEDAKIPPIEDFAAAITSVLNRWPKQQRPQLRLETGRHLIDDAGYLLASVAAVKAVGRRGEGKRAHGGYVLDTGVQHLYLAQWYRLNVMPTKRCRPQDCSTMRLYGNLCMAIDVIRDAVDLPALEIGDHVVLHPVGAYNLTQSMQFIHLRPAVVLIGGDGASHVIRRREGLPDIEAGEQVPARLQV